MSMSASVIHVSILCSLNVMVKRLYFEALYQVENLQKHVKAIGLSKKIELVVVSPLLRYLLQFMNFAKSCIYLTLLFYFFFCLLMR